MYTTDKQWISLYHLLKFSTLVRGEKASTLPPGQTMESALRQRVDDALADSDVQDKIGGWQIVWGPAVGQPVPSAPANSTLFVAELQTPVPGFPTTRPQLVVATAGTNPVSAYDLLVEDIWIVTTRRWHKMLGLANPIQGFEDARIASCTSVAVLGLLELLSPAGGAAAGTTLLDFLDGYLMGQPAQAGVDLWVCGHSQGGAIAPALALYAAQTHGHWTAGAPDRVAIRTFTTGAPSSGNRDFAALYDSELVGPGPEGRKRTVRVNNRNDFGPLGWADSTLETAKDQYLAEIPAPRPTVNLVVDMAKIWEGGNDYVQVGGEVAFAGPICMTSMQGIGGLFAKFKRYVRQMNYQHMRGYDRYFQYTYPLPALEAWNYVCDP
jgi:hypothetical protein